MVGGAALTPIQPVAVVGAFATADPSLRSGQALDVPDNRRIFVAGQGAAQWSPRSKSNRLPPRYRPYACRTVKLRSAQIRLGLSSTLKSSRKSEAL